MEVTPGKYRHFKGGEYEVIGVGHHSETLEPMVVYRALYESEDFGKDALWVRPLELFTDMKEVNGEMVPRFQKHES